MHHRSVFPHHCSAIALLLTFAACDSSSNVDGPATYVVDVSGETFRIQITDPAVAEDADSLLANDIPKIVHGYILAGDGGFNAPHNWHLDPDRISFPDQTIELCDGRPNAIDEDLDYWIDTVGMYCPWGAQITGRE